MKKLATCLFVAAGLLMATTMNAQTKIGYIDVTALVTAMPEFKKADTSMGEYQSALNEQYSDMIKEFNRKDSLRRGPDTLKKSRAQLDIMDNELQELYVKVQGWQREAQQLYNRKEQELLAPVQTKAMKAVTDVATENGYAYVFNRQTLVVDPPAADDLLPLVKKKLGLK